MLALFIAASLASPAAARREQEAIAACRVWMASRPIVGGSGDSLSVPGGLCFDGEIDAQGAGGFTAAGARLAAGSGPVIVVRSRGGEVGAGLDMAGAVRRLGATVVASQLCISSCANYVMGAARRRIVLAGTLLGFHGGAQRLTARQLLPAVREAGSTQPEEDARKSAADFAALVRRQDAFLAANRIERNFFSWMVRFNALSEARQDRICPYSKEVAFLVFAPGLLARHGYRIDDYRGPASDDAVRKAMAGFGFAPGAACYVDEREAF